MQKRHRSRYRLPGSKGRRKIKEYLIFTEWESKKVEEAIRLAEENSRVNMRTVARKDLVIRNLGDFISIDNTHKHLRACTTHTQENATHEQKQSRARTRIPLPMKDYKIKFPCDASFHQILRTRANF